MLTCGRRPVNNDIGISIVEGEASFAFEAVLSSEVVRAASNIPTTRTMQSRRSSLKISSCIKKNIIKYKLLAEC